jgi:hypothetical protein
VANQHKSIELDAVEVLPCPERPVVADREDVLQLTVHGPGALRIGYPMYT